MIKFIILSVALLIVLFGYTQDTANTKEEVIITAYRFPENIKSIPFTTKKITNKGWNMNVPNTADVLQNSGSVLVQKSQAGGGSPIIRGFEASRILLMVDGVRMNNAIYRSGHLQNAITVDANILNHIDILYGPASTQFGSDALGGVLNLSTKKPILSKSSKKIVTGAIANRFSSALNELQTHIDLNIGSKKWASLTSITYSSFGDLIQGSVRNSKYPNFGKKDFYVSTISGKDYKINNLNPNKQIASGYEQTDFLQKILYVPKEGHEHILNIQFSTTTNVPRYDRLSEVVGNTPRYAEWYYGPQKRFLAAYHYNANFKNGFFNKLQTNIAYQAIEESRYDRQFNNVNKNNRIENVAILSYTMDGLHKRNKVEIHLGIDIQVNKVKSNAFSENIVSNIRQNNITTRYPDGKNNMNSIAFYLQNIYKIDKNTFFNTGVRYTQIHLLSSFKNKNVLNFPFSDVTQNSGAFSGNAGFVHNTFSNWKFSALISSGFRAANFDELKVFDSNIGTLIVPNESIKPEYTYNAEINASKIAGAFQLNVALFYTLLQNAIQIDTFTFNGASSVIFQGSPSQVFAAQNKGKATLYGTSGALKYNFKEKTIIEGTITYTYGQVTTPVKAPLDHIPPLFGKFGIKHQEQKWNAEIYQLFNSWKKIKDYSNSGEDNQQYATIDGMPSWNTINVRTQYFLQPKIH
jgi:hemoglobin/transferrin/lactoferrin receptor protein